LATLGSLDPPKKSFTGDYLPLNAFAFWFVTVLIVVIMMA
jgi:hypothetical protein